MAEIISAATDDVLVSEVTKEKTNKRTKRNKQKTTLKRTFCNSTRKDILQQLAHVLVQSDFDEIIYTLRNYSMQFSIRNNIFSG